MNKVVLALATVATLGLSTAAFAENSPASTPTPASTQKRVQPAQSQAPVTHKMRASHRSSAKKVVVVRHRTLHRGVLHARHYGYDNGKKVVVKHVPANKTVRTKASS
jgi:ABC-type phosphate transport system substrate-binding protein